MYNTIRLFMMFVLFNTVTVMATESDMDGISKQIYSVCKGGNDHDTRNFMFGLSSGVRFTQTTYSKGKDRFDIRDDVAIKIACKNALNDKTGNRFSSKFKNALVTMFSN